jgi:amidophosphoribosyltransferase
LGYEIEKYLGPGEIILITADGYEQKKPPQDRLQVCAFLWVYYGYPATSYEGINVEATRNKCGKALAQNDSVDIDFVAGIPDSSPMSGPLLSTRRPGPEALCPRTRA